MKYEMIFCIVNSGFSEQVMDAARQAGATGGTVIRGRGTANGEAEEFFHIKIQPEKEIVMILASDDIKDGVLHALYKNVGLDSPGQGIAFAMPVDKTVGLPSGEKASGEKKTSRTGESSGAKTSGAKEES